MGRLKAAARSRFPCRSAVCAAVYVVALLAMLFVMAACGRFAPAAGTTPDVQAGTDTPGADVIDTPTQAAEGLPTDAIAVVLTPTATVQSSTTREAGGPFTSPRYGYTVMLPCCWIALPAPATAVEAALSDLADGTGDPLYGNLLEGLRADESGASLEYIAYLPDENGLPEAQLTVSVLPADQLTLEAYIDGVTAEIGGIGATAVVTGQIEPALGPNGTPAGVIDYTTIYEADPLHGLQIAFFSEAGDHLVVLTFTTNAAKFADLRPEFMDIARSVTFDS